MKEKKITVVINKNWETEPVINALTNSEIRPKELSFPQWVNSPKDGSNRMNAPRAILNMGNGTAGLQVSIWCIQDLMNPLKSGSSSEEKFNVLPAVLSKEKPDLVIAVGTAGYPSELSHNGSVIAGSNFFLYDGHPQNPDSNLKNENVGKLLSSNVNEKIFDLFTKEFTSQTEKKFIPVPNSAAQNMQCISSNSFVALSNINVTNNAEYAKVDKQGIEHCLRTIAKDQLQSVETTHGVIKLSTAAPILFVSAITDRLGHFEVEGTATQNYVAAFNAGIVIGQLLCSLNDFAVQGNTFGKI
jgi:hypothetical protein